MSDVYRQGVCLQAPLEAGGWETAAERRVDLRPVPKGDRDAPGFRFACPAGVDVAVGWRVVTPSAVYAVVSVLGGVVTCSSRGR